MKNALSVGCATFCFVSLMGCTNTSTDDSKDVTALSRNIPSSYLGCRPSNINENSPPSASDGGSTIDPPYVDSKGTQECGPASDINMKIDMGLKFKPIEGNDRATPEEAKKKLIKELKKQKDASGRPCFDENKGLSNIEPCITLLGMLQKEISEAPDGGTLAPHGAGPPDKYDFPDWFNNYPNCIIGFNGHIYTCAGWNEEDSIIRLRDPITPTKIIEEKVENNTIDGHKIEFIYGVNID